MDAADLVVLSWAGWVWTRQMLVLGQTVSGPRTKDRTIEYSQALQLGETETWARLSIHLQIFWIKLIASTTFTDCFDSMLWTSSSVNFFSCFSVHSSRMVLTDPFGRTPGCSAHVHFSTGMGEWVHTKIVRVCHFNRKHKADLNAKWTWGLASSVFSAAPLLQVLLYVCKQSWIRKKVTWKKRNNDAPVGYRVKVVEKN